MSVVSRLGVGRPVKTGANLTPMIDMTFLLVVFFILVSRITSVEQVPLLLSVPASCCTCTDTLRPAVSTYVLPRVSRSWYVTKASFRSMCSTDVRTTAVTSVARGRTIV